LVYERGPRKSAQAKPKAATKVASRGRVLRAEFVGFREREIVIFGKEFEKGFA
jgi:hypothetical protein